MDLVVKSGKALKGEILMPGDKSISHRSIMCAALAEGDSVIPVSYTHLTLPTNREV